MMDFTNLLQELIAYVYRIDNMIFVITVEGMIREVNGEAMLNEIQSSSNSHEQFTTTANEVLNSAPSINLLPPEKSKRKGRPRKYAYKNALDIAVKKNCTR